MKLLIAIFVQTEAKLNFDFPFLNAVWFVFSIRAFGDSFQLVIHLAVAFAQLRSSSQIVRLLGVAAWQLAAPELPNVI